MSTPSTTASHPEHVTNASEVSALFATITLYLTFAFFLIKHIIIVTTNSGISNYETIITKISLQQILGVNIAYVIIIWSFVISTIASLSSKINTRININNANHDADKQKTNSKIKRIINNSPELLAILFIASFICFITMSIAASLPDDYKVLFGSIILSASPLVISYYIKLTTLAKTIFLSLSVTIVITFSTIYVIKKSDTKDIAILIHTNINGCELISNTHDKIFYSQNGIHVTSKNGSARTFFIPTSRIVYIEEILDTDAPQAICDPNVKNS